MKITVNKKELLESVRFASRAAAKKSTLPALNHLLIKTGESCVTVVGASMEIWMRHKTTAKVSEHGSVLIPAKQFREYLEKSTENDVMVFTEDKKIIAECGTYVSSFSALAVDEFSEAKEVKQTTDIPQSELKSCLDRVLPLVCQNIGRPELCCVMLESGDGMVSFVGTNGAAMGVAKAHMEGEAKVSIPTELAGWIADSIPKDAQGNVHIGISDSMISVSNAVWSVTGKLVNRPFPSWREVVKMFDVSGTQVSIPREPMIAAIQKIKPFTDERFFPVEMNFGIGGIEVKSKGGVHVARELVPCAAPEHKTTMNPDYVRAILESIDGDNASLTILNEMPRGFKFESESFLGITMPCGGQQ